MLFENIKLKIEYIEECIDNDVNRSFVFTVNIKDFDTLLLNLVYDLEEDIIVKIILLMLLCILNLRLQLLFAHQICYHQLQL
ncbi:Hypothetical protein CRIB_623 [Romboutsia ilealis]|jgi:hypothetical protein|uniref:Uncharacterized protein n=1 Tax=Romboutsia ilealis TaxID=1115758 RepID=A0A1V1HZH6_9FIRM|nr:Hypothetical protein CRIB_623 [Romboutsia ilealis]